MVSRIAVTGATGMVGSHVVKHLLSKGYNVTAAIRSNSNISSICEIEPIGQLTFKQINLSALKTLVEAFKNVDVVVHTAGVVDPFAPRKEIYKINVEGTANILKAAQQAGVTQLIHISSLSVITGFRDQYGLTEDAPLCYTGETYTDSKVEAEKLLMAQAPSSTVHITCLRPGFIYGPEEKAWLPRLMNSLQRGKAALIDGGTKEANVIYIENLCKAIELSILNPIAFNKTYNLTDGQRITKKMLFDTICKELHYKPVTRVVPGVIAKPFCELVSLIAPALPVPVRRQLATYSKAAFRLAGINQGFNINKAEQELGYTDRVSFDEGMSKTLKYIKGEIKHTQLNLKSKALTK